MLAFEEMGKPEEYPEINLSCSEGENQQQTQPTHGVDVRVCTRATLVGLGRVFLPLHRHSCFQPLLINVEIQLVPVNLQMKITNCNSYFQKKMNCCFVYISVKA